VGFSFLKTSAFRNLADNDVDISGKDIFLVGENGQGKSNFLEALYFCSYASSFRGSSDRELAKTGEKNFSAGVSLAGSVYNSVNVVYREGGKKISIDGKKIDDRKELLSVVPSIVFCHEDMEFVSGSPERRRWFFDQTRSLWDYLYLDDLRKYRYVLKNRNTILKNASASASVSNEVSLMLNAVDPQFVNYGFELISKRQKTAEEFSLFFEPLYREISGISGINVKYLPSWKGENPDKILEYLCGKRESDIFLGVSNSGPHRDRYIFTRDGEEFSGKASTGQRRLLALLLRSAQAKVFSERTGKKPVLLLDDVLLELDGNKRQKFLSLMPEYDQSFYNFLPVEHYKNYRKDDTLVYLMEEGSVQKI
jgi:DNA replication and repair protein RecF